MNVYLSNLWNQLRSSFWLLPIAMFICSFLLSFFTIYLDWMYEHREMASSFWEGGADGARQLLATIAGSIITITGVVFSMTIVSLSLASTQYGSRILRNFMRDVVTQSTLGMFVATSTYALLILRTIKSKSHQEFIPNISITVSVFLAVASFMMLIYFIHHLSVRVQSSDMIRRVADDLLYMIENALEKRNETAQDTSWKECSHPLLTSQIGYLQGIDYEQLGVFCQKKQCRMEVAVRPGHFIGKNSVLCRLSQRETKSASEPVLKAFIIGNEKSPTQDLEYAIEQLVAIALRALGVNANDTFTANSALDYLGASLASLCSKDLNPPFYAKNPVIKLIAKPITFEGLTDASFNQIRQYGYSSPSILIHLLETLKAILSCCQNQEQALALKKHAEMVLSAGSQLFEANDRADVEERFEAFTADFNQTMIDLLN